MKKATTLMLVVMAVVLSVVVTTGGQSGCSDTFVYPANPDTCVQVVVLQNDFANTDGGYGFTITVTYLDSLPSYHAMHEVRRVDTRHDNVMQVASNMAVEIHLQNINNQVHHLDLTQ